MAESEKTLDLKRIKNLVIDFGGVIVNLTRNRCIEAFEQLGVDVHEKLTNNHSHKDMFMQLELGNITPDDFHESIRKLSSLQITDKQIDEAWIAMLDDVAEYKLELLLNLKQRYNTMLLSNTNIIHWEWAETHIFNYKGHHARDFFRRVYLSYEIHQVKPDIEIFEYVLKDAGINPSETLLIDDALVNCNAAEFMGISTYMPEPREDWSFLFT